MQFEYETVKKSRQNLLLGIEGKARIASPKKQSRIPICSVWYSKGMSHAI